MSRKKQLGWRIDSKVEEKFRSWVEEKHGKTRGKLGEELEKAMLAHIDEEQHSGESEGLHDKLDEVLARLPDEQEHTHTHEPGTSDHLAKRLASELELPIQTTELEKQLREDLEVGDPRTIENRKDQLRMSEHFFEVPENSVWFGDKETWANVLENTVPRERAEEVVESNGVLWSGYMELLEDDGSEESNQDRDAGDGKVKSADIDETESADEHPVDDVSEEMNALESAMTDGGNQ